MATDLTIEILKEIRDAVRTTNSRIDALGTKLSERIDATNERLDRMEQRQERFEAGLNDLGSFMRQLALDLTRHERFHNWSSASAEDVASLRERVDRIEERLGPA